MNKKKLEKLNKEMNENLNEIDKDLDEYYKKPSEKANLDEKKAKPVIFPGLTKFFQKTQESFVKIQEEWNTTIDKLLNESLERQKIRQQKRLERLNERKSNKKNVIDRQKIRQQRIIDRWERKRQRMNNYYKHQEELLEKRHELMEKNLKNKSEYNKEKLQNSVDRTKRNWKKSIRRQRNFESFLSSLNRWSWKRQMRFLLIIIPLLVIFVIVYSIIKSFNLS
jgi:hypothetical protein